MEGHETLEIGVVPPTSRTVDDGAGHDAEAVALLETAWRGRTEFPCRVATTRWLEDGSPGPRELLTAITIATLLPRTELARSIRAVLEAEVRRHGPGIAFEKDWSGGPPDVACTTLGYSTLLASGHDVHASAHRALDAILAQPINPVCSADVVLLACRLRRASDVSHLSRDLVRMCSGGHPWWGGGSGTDTSLYPLGRLVHCFPRIHGFLRGDLRAAVRRRLGTTASPIDIAQRIQLAAWLGLDGSTDLERLLELRDPSGWWPLDGIAHEGRFYGSRALTTAFALGAIQSAATKRVRRHVSRWKSRSPWSTPTAALDRSLDDGADPPSYDVFLSHGSADARVVERIAARLRGFGISTFVGQWHLASGGTWSSRLAQALRRSRTIAVCLGTDRRSTWRAQRRGLDRLTGTLADEARMIPVLLPGAQVRDVSGVQHRDDAVDLGFDGGFDRLVDGIRVGVATVRSA